MPPRRTAPTPSPARSSTRDRARDDDDWDTASVTSGSFKMPNSRSSKKSGSAVGLKDTSVNIAAAFHAAQTGRLPPQSLANLSVNSNGNQNSSRLQVPRAISPAEQLAQSARALSPVRFFLRPTEEDGDDYTSFSSVGNSTSNGLNTSGEGESYDYRQEEEFVRRAQLAQKAKPKAGIKPDVKKRRSRAAAEGDMPYRPADEDAASFASDDSGGEGEGIVRAGALQARAGTRGKRAERGEGYLGMGLGIQPRKRKGRKSVNGNDEESEDGTPGPPNSSWTPADEPAYRHSATPAQLLRALSPRLDRKSPGPLNMAYQQRRRPSDLRTIITNILHGVVMGLQFVVELGTNVIFRVIIRPLKSTFNSGKGFARIARDNWWKWLGVLFGLSLAVRLLDNSWRSKGIYSAPDIPPSNIHEMSKRLTSLEQATATLSDILRAMGQGESDFQRSSVAMKSKLDELGEAVSVERKRMEGVKGEWEKDQGGMQAEVDKLRRELQILTSQVTRQESAVSSESSSKTIPLIERDIVELKKRMNVVEQEVKTVLEDGRLVGVLERVLPSFMPVRMDNRGELHVEPVFWAEMKRVMMGQGEIETIVKRLIGEASKLPVKDRDSSLSLDEKKVGEWMDKAFDQRVAVSHWVSREMFTDMLNEKLHEFSRDRPQPTAPKQVVSPSTVTIKSSKGDDLTSFFTSLIDTALLKYSKDTLGRKDYALFTAGARVIPHLTSDTLVMRSVSSMSKWLLGSKDVQGRPPATALHPDISVGSCWPFEGGQGSLGIMLVDRVVVSDITIEHAPKELAIDIATSPRDVRVMGIVDDEEGLQKLAQYWASNPSVAGPEADRTYLPLGRFTYDPSAYSHIQTFPVSPDIVDLDIKIGVVIFEVESNWGGAATCLYRVRVHGSS